MGADAARENASDDGRRGARARDSDAQHDLETWSSDARVIVIIVRRLGPTPVVVVVVVVVVVAQTHIHSRPPRSRTRERVNTDEVTFTNQSRTPTRRTHETRT